MGPLSIKNNSSSLPAQSPVLFDPVVTITGRVEGLFYTKKIQSIIADYTFDERDYLDSAGCSLFPLAKIRQAIAGFFQIFDDFDHQAPIKELANLQINLTNSKKSNSKKRKIMEVTEEINQVTTWNQNIVMLGMPDSENLKLYFPFLFPLMNKNNFSAFGTFSSFRSIEPPPSPQKTHQLKRACKEGDSPDGSNRRI